MHAHIRSPRPELVPSPRWRPRLCGRRRWRGADGYEQLVDIALDTADVRLQVVVLIDVHTGADRRAASALPEIGGPTVLGRVDELGEPVCADGMAPQDGGCSVQILQGSRNLSW